MEFLSAVHTDIGIRKNTNQDSVLIKEAFTDYGEVMLAVVCDGMGGLAKGEVASDTLVRAFSSWFEEKFPWILYEKRKAQQDAVLKESIESNLARERGRKHAKEFLETKEGGKQFARFEFAQDKYSNGETTMQILENNIEPDNLYLLDEPEVSLSPQNQVKLAEEINKMARYLGIQFIIATHSPFMLGILNAKIYNLDTRNYEVQKWNELENVRYFYEFFKSKMDEFEK